MPAPDLTGYEGWKHCITALCRIPLTPAYVAERLRALRDPADPGTVKFVATWGEAHRVRVLAWFEQAAQELAQQRS